ncbi:hypothetical protein HOY80DRAFT_980508 [Tuber brumale]|nr:hypothetical protein HOY80DRAFT_980508 [Tuber brumale]
MTISSHFTVFLLAVSLLLCVGSLAAPSGGTGPTTKGPEIQGMSAYYAQLMKSIPILQDPKTDADVAANRKIMENAMIEFNHTYAHLLVSGEDDEVSPASHRICETTDGSPRWLDALLASHRVLNNGDRCVMTKQCNTFGTYGEASAGACAGGPRLWDHDCKVMWRWLVGICNGCVSNIDGVERTGGRYLFDHPSDSDVRIYHS